MNKDILIQVFIGGCIFLTGSFLLLRRGHPGSWVSCLIVWFAILPILFSELEDSLRKTLAHDPLPLRMGLLIFAPAILAFALLVFFFVGLRRNKSTSPLPSPPGP